MRLCDELRDMLLASILLAFFVGTATSAQTASVCSTLNFSGVAWTPTLQTPHRTALQLALNITGSFEGKSGWSNISNNFDGQGLSLGLLNQTLGTGSLQPLLLRMRRERQTDMVRYFTPDQWTSLNKMLDHYEKSIAPAKGEVKKQSGGGPRLLWRYDLYGEHFNAPSAQLSTMAQPSGAEAHAVSWAVTNIYTSRAGRTFKMDWRRSLTTLAEDKNYVSIQINAAEALHTQTLELLGKTGLQELRSYLVLFDFVVQNGGLYDSDLIEYQKNIAKNPKWNEVDKLTHLLTLRLRHVRRRFVEDVRSRKMAVINGVGVVHRLRRSLEQEYCYRGSDRF